MGYRRFTEEEDKMRLVIDAGEYQAIIEAISEEKTKDGLDKNGNPKPILNMAAIDLIVIDILGRERRLKDWVMMDGEMAWKYRHLAKSAGLIIQYDNDTLHVKDFIGKKVALKLSIKDGVNKNGEKVPRNNVVDYLKPMVKLAEDQFKDEDIAF